MTAGLLFTLAALFEWAGLIFIIKSLWQLTSLALSPAAGRNPAKARSSLFELLTGGLLLISYATIPHDIGRPISRLTLALVWPVMPFPAWFLVASSIAFLFLGVKAVTALNSLELRGVVVSGFKWLAFALLNLVWLIAMHEKVEILRGAIELEPSVVIGLLLAFVACGLLVHLLAVRWHTRGLGPRVATTLALVVGSAVFCLPLVWLLLTSFKEQSDNTGSSLVWVPRVTVQHKYFDSAKPLVSTNWQGRKVWATIINKKPQGQLTLEVERPFPLRGWRFQARPAAVIPEMREGPVVNAVYAGHQVQGFVRRELAGGEREVEILKPSDLEGTVYRAANNHVEVVSQVGVRWENYSEALEWLPIETLNGLVYLKNTLWLVTATVIGTLLSCSMVAYGFSRLRFPGRGALFAVMIATMMLPAAVTMLPRFLIWRSVGAIDTLVPIWLPSFTASAFNVFLLREFFKTVPAELEDAAKIDGCSPLRTYWQIMMPQIKPALTVIGIWSFMGAWNDFMSPLIYVSSPEKMPLSYAVQLFSTDKGGEFGLMMAFATMTTVPVLIVFLLGQKFFVQGVQLTGLGGK